MGNAELRLVETAAGSAVGQRDVDGDGTCHAEIPLAGITGLTASDVIP